MTLTDRARWGFDLASDLLCEAGNRVRFGAAGPRTSERLWVVPAAVERAFAWFPQRSGRVVGLWPPATDMPYDEHPHVVFALRHWRDGVPWAQTGAREHVLAEIARRGRQDGCTTPADVDRRFDALDALYEQVRTEGRLRTRQELNPADRREDHGILVHLGPDGRPVAGDSGKHRLTIARLLELPSVPVRVGIVHREAVPLLPALRLPPATIAGRSA